MRKYHRLITDSSKQVSCRMKDLLDQNLIEHNIFVPNESSFSPLQAVDQITNILENSMKENNVQVISTSEIHEEQTLIGDVDRIQQVLLNLVSNARKYVPKERGVIKFESCLIEENDQVYLQISVTDNGPGIKPGDETKLFKPFSKLADDGNLNPNGSGLGLNICKLICRNLGGDIKLELSDEYNGAKFTFWVAVKKNEEYDADIILTPGREVVLNDDVEINTKARLNMNAFLKQHSSFRALAGIDMRLSIICADD